jgi:hypothetical protein
MGRATKTKTPPKVQRSILAVVDESIQHRHGLGVRTHCATCGEPLLAIDRRAAVCPKGHGRVAAATTKREQHEAWLAGLPAASKANPVVFTIEGLEGHYRLVAGQRTLKPGSRISSGMVAARVTTKSGKRFARAFAPNRS